MADNIMDDFLLFVGSDDEVREELDSRIMNYPGEARLITRDVLIPYAKENGSARKMLSFTSVISWTAVRSLLSFWKEKTERNKAQQNRLSCAVLHDRVHL